MGCIESRAAARPDDYGSSDGAVIELSDPASNPAIAAAAAGGHRADLPHGELSALASAAAEYRRKGVEALKAGQQIIACSHFDVSMKNLVKAQHLLEMISAADAPNLASYARSREGFQRDKVELNGLIAGAGGGCAASACPSVGPGATVGAPAAEGFGQDVAGLTLRNPAAAPAPPKQDFAAQFKLAEDFVTEAERHEAGAAARGSGGAAQRAALLQLAASRYRKASEHFTWLLQHDARADKIAIYRLRSATCLARQKDIESSLQPPQ